MAHELTATLQSLCELDPPEISRQWIDQHDSRSPIERLIARSALVPTSNSPSVVCDACDEQHWLVPEYVKKGKYRGFCHINGYYDLSPKLLQRFAVDGDWVANEIASAIGIRRQHKESALSPAVYIGRARFGPYSCSLFFSRRLHDRSRFDQAIVSIKERAGSGPALVLTTTPLNLLPGSFPGRCAAILLENVLTFSSNRTAIDEAPILAVLNGHTHSPKKGGIGFVFSPGFRICSYNDEHFRFTDKQALAVEALYNAQNDGLPGLHQTEIQGKADTSQRVAQLFSGHPAYGVLIRYDASGFYWLAL